VQSPSYYYAIDIGTKDLMHRARLSDPAFGAGQPYYPTAHEALLEVLYGQTRDQGRRDTVHQIAIHLPYTSAYLVGVDYVDGHGAVVTVAEGVEGGAAGHELQAVWKLHTSDRQLQRGTKRLISPGVVTFDVGAQPAYLSASLQDGYGLLVDQADWYAPAGDFDHATPLPSWALPEAFDFLASVWHHVTSKDLFEVHRISPAGGLTQPVASRSDFVSRLTDFADMVKAIRVHDSLLEPATAKRVEADKSIERLKLYAEAKLGPPELDSARSALEVLRGINRLRIALQHSDAKPDLPTAMARLRINYPPDWSQAWEVVRHRAVGALGDLRRALESALP
jgi:hypothetical protein